MCPSVCLAELEEGSYRLLIIRRGELDHDDTSSWHQAEWFVTPLTFIHFITRHCFTTCCRIKCWDFSLLHTSVASCSCDMCMTPLFSVSTFVRLNSSDVFNMMTTWRETITQQLASVFVATKQFKPNYFLRFLTLTKWFWCESRGARDHCSGWCSTFVSMKPLEIFNETLGINSARLWRQNQEFKPKHDLFLTITNVFRKRLENLRPLNQRNIKSQHALSLQKCQWQYLLLSGGSVSVCKSWLQLINLNYQPVKKKTLPPEERKDFKDTQDLY